MGWFEKVKRRVGFSDMVPHAVVGPHVKSEGKNAYRGHIDMHADLPASESALAGLQADWSAVGGGHVGGEPVTPKSGDTMQDAIEGTTAYVMEKAEMSPPETVDFALSRTDGAKHYRTIGR
jgi:hypothetical protein